MVDKAKRKNKIEIASGSWRRGQTRFALSEKEGFGSPFWPCLSLDWGEKEKEKEGQVSPELPKLLPRTRQPVLDEGNKAHPFVHRDCRGDVTRRLGRQALPRASCCLAHPR